ncbi:RNA polymerase sigma factor [Pseudonocardia humida]|uniref:RNA polymerase sigma factor n=1 Tax=Pseudonocardia humida TaxID=2800819 RepID=UPI00207D29BE|nr:sigma-70 family RNA polymerase sigma factor [Pseudonocardia humida]
MEPSEVAGAVRRAATGDQDAWDSIVRSFSGLVWTVANGHRLGPADTAEVLQTTWLRLLENLTRIREPERLGGWLATTARRESLRMLRLRGRELPTDDEGVFTREPSSSPTPEEAVLDRDRDRRLWHAFSRLPDRCRRLLHLVVVLQPPYAEVATIMQIPVGSIGPTRARCLDRLRRLLVDSGDGPVVA